MNIIVNGEELTLNSDTTIEELLQKLKIKDKVMAVAVNMNIIKKDDWKNYKIKEGDKIELLHFVGGG